MTERKKIAYIAIGTDDPDDENEIIELGVIEFPHELFRKLHGRGRMVITTSDDSININLGGGSLSLHIFEGETNETAYDPDNPETHPNA